MTDWEGLSGQDLTVKILEKIVVSGKIPHAFLFAGIDGIGKEFTAIKFAQYLNNYQSELPNPLINNHISNFSEPYLKYIFPLPRGKNETDDSGPYEKLTNDDIQIIKEELSKKSSNPYYKLSIPKANNIKISSIRDIKKFLSLSFSEIRYRIVLISSAHLMNEEAQNALLKNLEEPPEGIIFILVTPFPALLRETIRSRCNLIHFQPLNEAVISDILKSYFNIEPELAEKVSVFANGSVSFGLKLIDNDFEQLLEKVISILRYSFAKKYSSALSEISYFDSAESISILINIILIWLNDVIKFRNNRKISFIRHADTIEKFSTKFPEADIIGLTSRLEYLHSYMKNNINMNLIALNIIFELSVLTEKK